MKGDRMLCLNPSCNEMFKDVDDYYDSRDTKIKRMCPYCGGTNTVNVEYYIEKYWKTNHNNQVALTEHQYKVFKLLKDKGVKPVA